MFPAVCLWVSPASSRPVFCVACCDGESYIGQPIRKAYPSGEDVNVLADGWTPKAGEIVQLDIRFFTARGRDGYEILSLRPMESSDCTETEKSDLYNALEDHNRRQRAKQKTRRIEAISANGMEGLHGITRYKSRWTEE
jgi:hypothetical protein